MSDDDQTAGASSLSANSSLDGALSGRAHSKAQADLFSAAPFETVMSDGTPYTPWQMAVVAEWHRRHPKPISLTYGRMTVVHVARGVYCATCGTGAVMFPGESMEYPDNKGYCICPKCSQPKHAEAA